MPEQDHLPPLPPPLRPTHSRSFSSSSSSSAGGSPQPSTSQWGALPSLARRDSAASTSSASTSAGESRRRRNAARSEGDFASLGNSRLSPPKRGPPPALARTLSAASSSSASSSTGASPRVRSALSAAAISAADLDFPRSSSGTPAPVPASADKLPSPSASSFHPHPHGTTASLGLGGSPSFPAPSAFFTRPHTSHAQQQTQLPSPPRTASDSGTLRLAAPPAAAAQDAELDPPRRRLRARASSAGDALDVDGADEEVEGTEDAERRRERRARMADDVRAKNQRILDSINGVPPAPAPAPVALRRSDTSSTIRDFAEGGDGSLADEQAPAFDRRLSAASSTSSFLDSPPAGDFGFLARSGDGPRAVPRSRTLGDLDRTRSQRTRSYHPRTPSSTLAAREPASAPPAAERASTSLGYSSVRARATPRRSDLLLASRAASALGGSGTGAGRDAAIERSLRVSASRDGLASAAAGEGGARERVQSLGRAAGRAASRLRLDLSDYDDDDGPVPAALRRHTRAATASPTLALRRPQSSLALATPPPGSRAGRRADEEEGEGEEEEETTPKSGRKRGSKESGGSGGAAAGEGRYSRLSGARSGTLRNGIPSLSPLSTTAPGSGAPPPPASARSDDRLSSVSNEARRDRLRGVEVGSEAWMAEFEDIRRRTVRSRASGSSGDASARGGSSGAAEKERDRTIRAINALLAGQGIVASAAADESLPLSPASSSSSPQKRAADRPRRISFAGGGANGTPSRVGAESALKGLISQAGAGAEEHHRLLFSALEQFEAHFASSGGAEDLIARMTALVSSTTRLNAGLRGLAQGVRTAHVATQVDEARPSGAASEVGAFEKSVGALLRASDDQVRCLSEDLVAFARTDRERARRTREGSAESRPVSRASTYRSSYGGSMAGAALYSPPKRAATSSPFDGAGASGGIVVSHASARSPSLATEVLRDPLSPALDDLRSSAGMSGVNRRHTLGYASASRGGPIGHAQDSPTPLGGSSRRESAHVRSPLAMQGGAFETPSRAGSGAGGIARRQSIASSSAAASDLAGLGLPLPHASGGSVAGARRSKTSDTTVRPSSPSAIRFPTHSDTRPTTLVDASSASAHTSPTHAPPLAPFRAYSDADQSRALRALEMGANLDEDPHQHHPHTQQHAHEEAYGGEMARQPSAVPSLRTRNRDLPDLPQTMDEAYAAQHAYAPPPVAAPSPAPQESPSRKSRMRISSGGLGAALKNALSRGGGDRRSMFGSDSAGGSPVRQATAPPPPPQQQQQGYYPSALALAQAQTLPRGAGAVERPSSAASSVDAFKAERRQEIEGILRRAAR
ncbi:hypothetical protein JCM10450v2_004136 [Rhodotorula kratochvilovae]